MPQRTMRLTYDTPFASTRTRRKPVVSLTRTDIAVRYPRLIHAMQWVACLSNSEAISCIRDYQRGDHYSGEAVNHFGGTRAVITRAASARTRGIVADQRRHVNERLREVARGLR